jgi:methylisocitrate lyase
MKKSKNIVSRSEQADNRPAGGPRKATASAGARFRAALAGENPLQIVGVIHAYAAMLAERAGFGAIYLSGAGVANASYALPDVGITSLDDVLIDVRRVVGATQLPLIVDADTGWNDPRKTVYEMVRAGAAGIHIEDQVAAKRCGHLTGKRLVSPQAMVNRIRAAAAGRGDPAFMIIARTDAAAVEGIDAAIQRARSYRAAGADMIFAEALSEPSEYRRFCDEVGLPILANLTEFGKTPLYSVQQMKKVGVRAVLYPLSAFRAMNAAAGKVYTAIRTEGTQKSVLDSMQTRAELYATLGYNVKPLSFAADAQRRSCLPTAGRRRRATKA